MDRMQNHDELQQDRLSGLMTAYRDSFPEVDASPNFMPQLWQRIEARRVETASIFKRLAQICVAATAVALFVITATTPQSGLDNEIISRSYTEVLAADHADQAYIQVLTADVPGLIR